MASPLARFAKMRRIRSAGRARQRRYASGRGQPLPKAAETLAGERSVPRGGGSIYRLGRRTVNPQNRHVAVCGPGRAERVVDPDRGWDRWASPFRCLGSGFPIAGRG